VTDRTAAANIEKQRAARSSLLWAAFLTAIKLGAGLATNSLGIFSEALHSGLDLVAAAITLFAVRLASRPADKAYPYGYGKAESLAALAETGLLLLTCGWIVYEAVERLFFSAVQVTPTFWGAAVIAVALFVDISRSRMLRRVAAKHNSQALEADALHFSTDVWSSVVVLLGLAGLWAASFFPVDSWQARILCMGDAVAALFVAGLVAWVSMRLMARSAGDLMDAGNAERADELKRELAEKLPGCKVCQLRVRQGGALYFVDMTVEIQPGISLDEAHDLTRQVEEIVRGVLPSVDVTVHVEPMKESGMGILQIAHALAAGHALSVHNLTISERDGHTLIFLHVEVPHELDLYEAHRRVASFERKLEQYASAAVVTHIEPEERLGASVCEPLVPQEEARIRAAVTDVQKLFKEIIDVHDLRLYHFGGAPMLSLHCRLPGHMSVREAHNLASQFELRLLEKCPALRNITIHTDPAQEE